MKKSWVAGAALAVMIVFEVVCWTAFKPETVEGMKAITVEITHKDTAVNTYYIETEQLYLYDALVEQGLIGELVDGYFTELDGETADTLQEEWWGYTKFGEYVNYGVVDCAIEDGDHYEFTFNIGW